MSSKEQKLAILRLFLRDFNKQIKSYGAGNSSWFLYKPALLMSDEINGIDRVYKVLFDYGLKEIEDAKTEIKKEFDKYPHIKKNE